jgi:hypothetical protein
MGLVDDLHDRRFKAYKRAKNHKSMHNTMDELVQLHRMGINVALHVSEVINEDHTEYMRTLHRLGEPRSVIR